MNYTNGEAFACFGNYGYLGMTIHIILFGLFLYGLYLLINKFYKGKGDSAISILEKRFAKGEIDKKEFKEKKSELTK